MIKQSLKQKATKQLITSGLLAVFFCFLLINRVAQKYDTNTKQIVWIGAALLVFFVANFLRFKFKNKVSFSESQLQKIFTIGLLAKYILLIGIVALVYKDLITL